VARKSRLDPGGYAYGELTGEEAARSHRGGHRDAPLSTRGRLVWRIVVAVLVLYATMLLGVVVVSAFD
jgi:hypothetical protein